MTTKEEAYAIMSGRIAPGSMQHSCKAAVSYVD